MTTRAALAEQARDNAVRDAAVASASFEKSLDDMSGAVQRAQAERDGARHDLHDAKSEHDRLLSAALRGQTRAAEKGAEDGRNAGIKLGRLLEKYGDDWTELSDSDQADRKQRAQQREAQLEALKDMVERQKIETSRHDDELRAEYQTGFEAGKAAGYDQAWKEVEVEGDVNGEAPEPQKSPVALRPPRWRIYHSSFDDPTDDEWTIQNPVKGCGITSLRLDIDRKLFSVYDAADWPDVEFDQESFTFRGGVTRLGGANGYAFTLMWTTNDGRIEVEDVPPEEVPLYAGW